MNKVKEIYWSSSSTSSSKCDRWRHFEVVGMNWEERKKGNMNEHGSRWRRWRRRRSWKMQNELIYKRFIRPTDWLTAYVIIKIVMRVWARACPCMYMCAASLSPILFFLLLFFIVFGIFRWNGWTDRSTVLNEVTIEITVAMFSCDFGT